MKMVQYNEFLVGIVDTDGLVLWYFQILKTTTIKKLFSCLTFQEEFKHFVGIVLKSRFNIYKK